ncbi:hypothetical protein BACCIP111883_02317 [Sutcliffiella rhizosphaerae]|uniref:Uncharacterized protein n=1 Tax=Sutcliffiella rhizosphaerae TaxID=2880967 RepID=A0ABN8AAQ0_9BACI|nr:hypothetical protein BACCIP111883_02317 [Sutcliffiella rhizosphaerae]
MGEEGTRTFQEVLDKAQEQTNQTLSHLPTEVQEVFVDSLHDSTIERIEREEDTLHIYVNTDGGFSSKAFIHFTFSDILSEKTDVPLQVDQWFIYYELQKTNEGFAFRVLFECPESEWTIDFKKMEAKYYYRPVVFERLKDNNELDGMSLNEYIKELNPAYNYYLNTPDVSCTIKSLKESMLFQEGEIEITNNQMNVTVDNKQFNYDLDQYNPIHFIYTNVYEDPYAHLQIPVAIEELEAAATSDDIELQVRAWNTMYSNPNELAKIINRVLLSIEKTEENEMMISVYVNHFYAEGILSDMVIEKYQNEMMK